MNALVMDKKKTRFFETQLHERLRNFEMRCTTHQPASGLIELESLFPILMHGSFELVCCGQKPGESLLAMQADGRWPVPLLSMEPVIGWDLGMHMDYNVLDAKPLQSSSDLALFTFHLRVSFSYTQMVRAVTMFQALERAQETLFLPEGATHEQFSCELAFEEIEAAQVTSTRAAVV